MATSRQLKRLESITRYYIFYRQYISILIKFFDKKKIANLFTLFRNYHWYINCQVSDYKIIIFKFSFKLITQIFRAYNAIDRFTEESRIKLDANNKTFWLNATGDWWLALRLDFMGTIVVFLTAALVIYKKESLNAGSVALIVSYALIITNLLTWCVRNVSQLETSMVSIERIKFVMEIF